MSQQSKSLKISLLAISLIFTSPTAITASIPAMQHSFTSISETNIEFLVTAPSFFMVLGILISPILVKYLREKSTVLLGLIIAGISGTLPVFTDNYSAVLATRILLGLGLGIYNSLAVSMISLFFQPPESVRLIGFQNSFQNFGSAIMTLIAGYLLLFNWHLAFGIYALAFVLAIMFYSFVPDTQRMPHLYKTRRKNTSNFSFSFGLFSAVIGMFTCMIFYTGITLKFTPLMELRNLATPTQSSVTLTVMLIVSGISALAFDRLSLLFKQNILLFALFLLGSGYFLITFSNNFVFASLGLIISGVSFSIYGPYFFSKTAALKNCTPEISAILLLVGANVGNFVTPFMFKLFGTLANYSLTAELIISSIIITVIFLSYIGILKSKLLPKSD